MRQRFLVGLGSMVAALLLAGAGAYGAVQRCDSAGNVRVVLRVVSVRGGTPDDAAIERTQRVIEERVTGGPSLFSLFAPCPSVVRVTKQGAARFVDVTLRGIETKEVTETVDMLRGPGVFTLVGLSTLPLRMGSSAGRYPVLAREDDLDPRGIEPAVDILGVPAVDVRVHRGAAARIDAYGAAHRGNWLGVALDGRIRKSIPIVQPLPAGTFPITNVGSAAATRNVAAILKFGPLPVQLQIVSVRR